MRAKILRKYSLELLIPSGEKEEEREGRKGERRGRGERRGELGILARLGY